MSMIRSRIRIMSTTGHHRSGQWHSVKGSIAIVPSRRRHHPIGYRMLQNTAWQFPSRSHKATFDQKLTRLLRRLHVPACSLSHDRYFSPQLAVVWLGGNDGQSGRMSQVFAGIKLDLKLSGILRNRAKMTTPQESDNRPPRHPAGNRPPHPADRRRTPRGRPCLRVGLERRPPGSNHPHPARLRTAGDPALTAGDRRASPPTTRVAKKGLPLSGFGGNYT